MTQVEKRQAVEDTLKYLIEEGMVIKLSDGRYRLKSESELELEMDRILND